MIQREMLSTYGRGNGTRADNDADPVVPASPWRYTRAKHTPNTKVANDSALHDFNDEAIGITFPGTIETVRLKNPSFIFGTIDISAPTTTYTSVVSLQERVRVGLPSSITLVCEGAAVGSHDIVIWDATNDDDFPIDGVPDDNQPRQSITFTLHVTPATTTIAGSDTIEPDIQRIAVEDAVEPVYVAPGEHLTFTGENNRIRYEVVRGSGTLYLGTLEEEHTTPSTVITVHQSSNVFLNTNNGSNEVHVWFAGEDRSAPRATIVFEYRGQPVPTTRPTTTRPTTTTTTTTQTGSLTITATGTGTTRTVTVNAVSAAGTPTAIPAVLTGTATSTQTIITGTATEITLPTAPGSYTLTATASVAGYNPDTETITVAGPTSLGTISISQIGTPTNGVQTFSITVRRTDGTTPAPLTVTVSGTGFTSSSVPTANGSGAVNITLPTTAGLYTLTARATGYTSGPTTVRIAGTGQQQQQPAQQQPAQQQPTVSEPDSISIVGPSQRDGTVNEELGAALVVEVVDDDGEAVEDARVIFRVRSGQGRLSQGGRGRAIAVQTDSRGHARANYTPTGGGTHTVEAEVRGVTRTVEFTITTGSAPPPRDLGTREEPSPTVSPCCACRCGESSADVMGRRWCDLRTRGCEMPERFAPSVDNALNIAVGGGKVYWTEKTGENSGTINSANLNGSDVTELTPISRLSRWGSPLT